MGGAAVKLRQILRRLRQITARTLAVFILLILALAGANALRVLFHW